MKHLVKPRPHYYNVWCPTEKTMYENCIVGGNVVIASANIEEELNELEPTFWTVINDRAKNAFIPLQYTGSDDIDNNKIVEGHIVDVIDKTDPTRKERSHVRFHEGAFVVEYDNGEDVVLCPVGSVHLDDKELKVIGNVFQHPHLLDETNEPTA